MGFCENNLAWPCARSQDYPHAVRTNKSERVNFVYSFVASLICSRAVANLQLGHKPRSRLGLQ